MNALRQRLGHAVQAFMFSSDGGSGSNNGGEAATAATNSSLPFLEQHSPLLHMSTFGKIAMSLCTLLVVFVLVVVLFKILKCCAGAAWDYAVKPMIFVAKVWLAMALGVATFAALVYLLGSTNALVEQLDNLLSGRVLPWIHWLQSMQPDSLRRLATDVYCTYLAGC